MRHDEVRLVPDAVGERGSEELRVGGPPPYLYACSRRSTGNAYRNAACVAAKGGTRRVQRPHVLPSGVDNAQTGHAGPGLGSRASRPAHAAGRLRAPRTARSAVAAQVAATAGPGWRCKVFCRDHLTSPRAPADIRGGRRGTDLHASTESPSIDQTNDPGNERPMSSTHRDHVASASCGRPGLRRYSALVRRRGRGAVRAAVQRTSCSARRPCTARISMPTRCSCPRCCRSRPAAARRTAATARRRRAITPASGTRTCWRSTTVVAAARAAKDDGATRFCMGAAWRGPKQRDLDQVIKMVRAVRALGMETCATLGMLKEGQAEQLKRRRPRLLQPQPRHRARVLRRDRHDARAGRPARHARARARRRPPRLLRRHRRHGRNARAARGADRAAREPRPVPGIGADQQPGAGRRHAAARCTARRSIRSNSCAPSPARASRCRRRWCACPRAARAMSEAVQALCFLAGANSIFYGESCSPPAIPKSTRDRALLAKLGLAPQA